MKEEFYLIKTFKIDTSLVLSLLHSIITNGEWNAGIGGKVNELQGFVVRKESQTQKVKGCMRSLMNGNFKHWFENRE